VKKILFIATVESHILNFHIPFIKYFQEKGYEVHIATKLSNQQDELKDIDVICHNIDFSRCPYSFSNIKALKQLISVMKKDKFSLVHVHTPVGAFLGRLAARSTDTKPVLYTAHGFHFFKGSSLKNWLIYYTMEKIAARWTDGLITINQEDYEVAKKLPLRKRDAIYYVHGVGLDIKKYDIQDGEVRKRIRNELGLRESDILFITVAELNTNKNYLQIIKAIKEIDNIDNIYFVFVGDGELKSELKGSVKALGIDKHVYFLGFRRDISELLFTSDIFCLLSYREGLPRCIMEAMAAGKPVIASDVRGNRDLVQNNINGLLVPINDINKTVGAIEKLAYDRDLRYKMGQEGRKIIDEYSIERVLGEMDEIYNIYL